MMLIQESEAIAGFAILDNLLLMRHHQWWRQRRHCVRVHAIQTGTVAIKTRQVSGQGPSALIARPGLRTSRCALGAADALPHRSRWWATSFPHLRDPGLAHRISGGLWIPRAEERLSAAALAKLVRATLDRFRPSAVWAISEELFAHQGGRCPRGSHTRSYAWPFLRHCAGR
jgi:hypothetical protein